MGSADGPPRRQTTGLDARRFQLMAAVLARVAGHGIGRAELFGASSGGMRIDDPAADLAIAAALASAVTGIRTPGSSAFVGEVSLTGLVRPAPGLAQRLAAAEAAGCRRVFAAPPADGHEHPLLAPVRPVAEALVWTQLDPIQSRRRAS